jgi:hypothetical protein
VKRLKESSASRIATDAGFKLIAEDIKTYKDGELERSRISLKEKSAKEKAAEKEKLEKRSGRKKSKDGAEADNDAELSIAEDYHLQETLRVAADYVNLRLGRTLAKLTIPEVARAEKAKGLDSKKKTK